MKKLLLLAPLLALFCSQAEEPAASPVKALLEEASQGQVQVFLSIINLGEVVCRIGRARGESAAMEALEQMRRLPIKVIPATEEALWPAVRYRMHHAISHADACAAAAAESLDASLATGDPELAELRGVIEVEELRRGVAKGTGGSAPLKQ